MFIGEWIGFVRDWLETGTTHCYWVTLPTACIISIVILLLPSMKWMKKTITFVSGVSFEMYLVHSAMLGWTKPLTDNAMIYLVLFLAGTVFLAIAVNKASAFMKKAIGV